MRFTNEKIRKDIGDTQDMEINQNEVMTAVATNIIEDTINLAWEKVCKFFKDLDTKDSIRYGEAYEEYLRNTKNKYSKIKTLIYRHVSKDIYSFYECIGVRHNGETIDTSDINNIINVDSRVIITGTGGIGKTILLKHLFLNTIDRTGLIPVLIELRSFNIVEEKNIVVKSAIYDALEQHGFKLENEYFEYSLEEGGYVILLDGFDEINRDKMAKVSSEIRSLCSKYPNNKYIISSRPSDEFIGWHEFSEMFSLDLTKEQALSLVKKIEFDEVIKERFYKELEDNLYDKYTSFASNPLLLNIMLLTFNNNASIPDKLNDFYEQAFATLFNMHDATKEAYVRDIRTGLGCEDFKLVFAYICFKSYFKDEYEFLETRLREYVQQSKEKFDKIHFTVDDFVDDLTMSVCMLVKEGINYRFSHRSFQEYFAAWYTCKLTDDIQYRLLTNWLKESSRASSDAYFTMLFNMQGEKVNKIIFAPAIKEIKQKIDKEGYGWNFFNYLFKGISLRKSLIRDEDGEQKEVYSLSLGIKHRFYCSILILTCRLNHYVNPRVNYGEQKEVSEKLKEIEKPNILSYISFENALEVVEEEKLYRTFEWFKHQLEFCFKILEDCEKNNVSRKKKVNSILDEI